MIIDLAANCFHHHHRYCYSNTTRQQDQIRLDDQGQAFELLSLSNIENLILLLNKHHRSTREPSGKGKKHKLSSRVGGHSVTQIDKRKQNRYNLTNMTIRKIIIN